MEENAHSSRAENNTIFATEHCINYSEHVGADNTVQIPPSAAANDHKVRRRRFHGA